MSVERYLVSKARLLELAGGDTYFFNEITVHAFIPVGRPRADFFSAHERDHPESIFPETFVATITPDGIDNTNDTNSIRYYRNSNDADPFLIMGYADDGCLLTEVIIRAVGTRLN